MEAARALEVLRLPVTELSGLIESQLEDNPLLERLEDGLLLIGEDAGERDRSPVLGERSADDEPMEAEATAPGGDGGLHPGWADYFADSSDLGLLPAAKAPGGDGWEPEAASLPTLEEHLKSQLGLVDLSPLLRHVGDILIGLLDPDGYLRVSLEEACSLAGCTPRVGGRVLAIIQDMEPAGVGARDLAECLRIQLLARGCDDWLVHALVNDGLQGLARGSLRKMARQFGVSVERVEEAALIVRALDPRPGRGFGGRYGPPCCYVVPDACVHEVEHELVVTVEDGFCPALALNPHYARLLSEGLADHGALRFLQRKLKEAVWFIRSVEQRRNTLYRVVQEIASRQRAFMTGGRASLQPLSMTEVAAALGIHESTVSRAVSGKYVQTPRGLFRLGFFFTRGLGQGPRQSAAWRKGCEIPAESAHSAKTMIQEMVRAEDGGKPLSDREISDRLRERGVLVARRTVAKYRSELELRSSQGRKRYSG